MGVGNWFGSKMMSTGISGSVLKKRARQQATEMEKPDYVHAQGDYNIWYHKRLGDPPAKRTEVSTGRLDPVRDIGLTKADTLPGKHYLCVYFARGKCVHGHNCLYYHRLPVPDDEKVLPITHDIFGRERHQTDRDDMGGVGNFNRDNRTLYVGGLKSVPGVNLEKALYEQFSVYGEIEYVRVIISRMIAFVRFKLRTVAEFAKEAMADQSLGFGDILNIRWSNEDPNPAAKRYEQQEITRKAAVAVIDKSKEMGVPDYLLEQHPELSAEPHPYILGNLAYTGPDKPKLEMPTSDTPSVNVPEADLSSQKEYFLQWAQFFAQQGIDPSQLDEQTILYYQQYYTYQYSLPPFYAQLTASAPPIPQSDQSTGSGHSESKSTSEKENNSDKGENAEK